MAQKSGGKVLLNAMEYILVVIYSTKLKLLLTQSNVCFIIALWSMLMKKMKIQKQEF